MLASMLVESSGTSNVRIRRDWRLSEVEDLYSSPLLELVYAAATMHRRCHNPREVQKCTLLSIKTGGCPEDCGYCSQSAHHDTGVKATKLMGTEEVLAAAKRAKASGAQRFCMGAAWRSPKDRDMDKLCDMVRGVAELSSVMSMISVIIVCCRSPKLYSTVSR